MYLNYEVSLVQKSLETSHPISVDVNNPKEINYIFDAISYDKVIKLSLDLKQILKNVIFLKGLKCFENDKLISIDKNFQASDYGKSLLIIVEMNLL